MNTQESSCSPGKRRITALVQEPVGNELHINHGHGKLQALGNRADIRPAHEVKPLGACGSAARMPLDGPDSLSSRFGEVQKCSIVQGSRTQGRICSQRNQPWRFLFFLCFFERQAWQRKGPDLRGNAEANVMKATRRQRPQRPDQSTSFVRVCDPIQ